MTSQSLLSQLRELGLCPADDTIQRQLRDLSQTITDGKLYARAMIQRDWLTPYQANQLLTGKRASLVVGRYVILARLGEGAMGQVYKARHRDSNAVVALKILRPERVGNPITVSRFLREVYAAAKLTHANVVRAVEAVQVDGFHCYAMEYVEGVDLARLIKKEGRRPVAQACAIVHQTALGLGHIHEHGMVHRDVKPGNIMIAKTDGAQPVGLVKLLDLGLARLNEDPREGARPALTRLGTVMGTPDFMAPEQARDPRAADIRGDIYSLGCILYYCLAGHAPFPGGNAVEKMMHHQIDEPAPLERLRPEVTAELAVIVRRLMAKQPGLRYQTAAEAAEALAPFAMNAAPVEVSAAYDNAVMDGQNDPFEWIGADASPRRSRGLFWKLAAFLVLAGGTAVLILLALWLRSLAL